MKKIIFICSAIILSMSALTAHAQDFRERNFQRDSSYSHRWTRGDRMPQEYWHHGHEVNWRNHHLRRPPAGYHWVQANDQFALVGINTGTVSAVFDIR